MQNLIFIENVTMNYPVPKRFREYLLKPFKNRGKTRALDNVSLEIPQGQRIAFLGPNGAGKTTLLKLIGGLLLPSQGTILINSYDTGKKNAKARQKVGIIMNEERSFYWKLTGRQNLEFFGILQNIKMKNLHRKIDDLTETIGLTPFIYKRVEAYSSGMKQRLAIARGLLSEPDIVILDEPTRTLDPIAKEELIDFLINHVHQNLNKTILIATHRLEEVEKLCNRIVIINHGKLIAFKSIPEINSQYNSILEFYKQSLNYKANK